jgi:hypothetical protein
VGKISALLYGLTALSMAVGAEQGIEASVDSVAAIGAYNERPDVMAGYDPVVIDQPSIRGDAYMDNAEAEFKIMWIGLAGAALSGAAGRTVDNLTLRHRYKKKNLSL